MVYYTMCLCTHIFSVYGLCIHIYVYIVVCVDACVCTDPCEPLADISDATVKHFSECRLQGLSLTHNPTNDSHTGDMWH